MIDSKIVIYSMFVVYIAFVWHKIPLSLYQKTYKRSCAFSRPNQTSKYADLFFSFTKYSIVPASVRTKREKEEKQTL